MKKLIIGGLLGTILLIGCSKENITVPDNVAALNTANKDVNIEYSFGNYEGLDRQTSWELQQARAATARYRNINNAFADGYTNINVIVPNMGHHFMKSGLVDANFEIRYPEILVYNRDENGNFELVAVEYAVPISLSPSVAPEGFTGDGDVWDENTSFGLWLLHAWVWYYNPDGVFNPTNPDVHLH